MRQTTLKRLVVAALLCAAVAPARVPVARAQAQGGGWTPELQMKVRGVGPVRVSPDGRRVAYGVTDAVMTADKSEMLTQIWVADADGSNAFQVTHADKSSTNPQWSPDGNWLAFTSTRRDNKNNVFLLRMSGGEAEPLTEVKTAVGNFAFSPDGKWIAFTMRDALSDEEEKSNKGRADYRWVDENVKMSRLYLIPVERAADGKREPRKLTAQADYTVDGDFSFSPDGRWIAFSHTRTSKANDWPSSDISAVEVATGNVVKLAATRAAENTPRYSPDGKWIAFLGSDDPPRWAQSNLINVMPAAGGQPKALAATHDGQPGLGGWSADGRAILFSEARGTGTQLYTLDVASNKITEIGDSRQVVGGLSLNSTRTMVGFTAQASDRAPEAYVSRADKFAPVQVSRANADLPKLPLGKTEVIRWKSADGREVEGLLTYPVGYQPGRRVPLILNVHGGPAGVFQQTFIGSRGAYPLASFASKGYAILRPNPRGSSGYGTEFRRANIKDWGFGDYQDLMTGVDKVIEMGVADPERLGVMGWSYGGYMTSWVITQTKRFKAASAGAPVTNLVSFVGTADIPDFLPDYFGGQPWDIVDTYRKHSPMFNVKGATTPTMIQHGEADDRVPISQGYELYNSLKAQGVPTRMIVLPRQPHGPNEPKMLLKVMQTNLEWFDKYIGPGAQASQTAPATQGAQK
jgi:dipeptidyl aminopeptidase/acylaminoacyl peptidase